MVNKTAKTESFQVEEAFTRLEKILELMNEGSVNLDDALKYYEEADKLILACHKRLSEAEKKVEILLKTRSGELELSADGTVQVDDFEPSRKSSN